MTPRPELVRAVIQAESGGNPLAVSPVGAMGLMQAMPATARDPGFGVKPLLDPFDPAENERFGTEYLGAMLKRYGGDEEAALAAYNWGPGNADKWVSAGKSMDMLPSETRNYIARVSNTATPQQPARSGGGIMNWLIGSAQAGELPQVDWAAELGMGAAPAEQAADEPQVDWAAELGLAEPKRQAAPQEKIEPLHDSSRAAGIADIGVASLADDPMAQARYYAQQRGIPVERYRIVDGEPVYQGDDGQWYRERPGAQLTDPMSWAQSLAGGVGDALPIVAGGAAGIASAPLLLTGPAGMAGSMALTGAAAAGGQTLREGLANRIMGQEMSPGRIGTEAAQAALGQGIGAGLTAWGQRYATHDIGRLNRPAVDALRQTADDQGIPLTPAEVTNLPSLKAQQKALGNLPRSADTIDDFYRTRANTIAGRVGQVLDDISPVDSAEVAGRQAREAADTAISQARQARTTVARPLYERVMRPENVVPRDAFKPIADDEFLAGLIKTTKADRLSAQELGQLPDNALPVLDSVKKQLDDMIEVARRGGERNKVRLLQGKLDKLLNIADDAFPDYPVARAAFAGRSPEVDALESGIVGIIRDLPDTRAQSAAAKLFDPSLSGPNAVATARDAISKADPQAWQAIKRSWIQQQWEKAGREYASTGSQVVNQGPKFRALLLGDENRRRMLKEALSLNEWKALNDLSEVLEAAGRVKPLGSDTAWNQEAMRLARQEATPAWGAAVDKIRVWDWPKMLREWSTERNLNRNAEALAKVITSPDAMSQLRQLKQLSPASARYRVGLGHLLAVSGFAGAEDLLTESGPLPVAPAASPASR